jgi:hypothetical protein
VGVLSDGILGSVVDPHHFAADPNPGPAFHFYADLADPDPIIHSDGDPDPTTHFFQIWTLQCPKMTFKVYTFSL